MDIVILLIVIGCSIAGFAVYYAAKVIFVLLWILVSGISLTRWHLNVISTEGQTAWDARPWTERTWITIKFLFTDSIPNVAGGSRITKGDHYWESINDHNP